MLKNFYTFLVSQNLSTNTIKSYIWSANYFLRTYKVVNRKNTLAYKGYLIENYKPMTVNLRLQGLNKYLEYINRNSLKLRFVKVQQKNFLENVISDADYKYLKNRLEEEGQTSLYFAVWFLTATGARVSELLQIKVEHVKIGYLDIYSKGGKQRRLYIPKELRNNSLKWLEEINVNSGYIFLNRYGQRISARGLSSKLKAYAKKYGIDTKVVHPHSFRHRFAKNFLERCNDISLLADLMGHESIETTRIYLRRTSTEQQTLIDNTVNW